MNTMRNDTRHLLDLLVDNELSEDERRELLARCEAQPDGWRACALAFLEAQDWSNTFGEPRATELAAPTQPVSDPKPANSEIAERQRPPLVLAGRASPPRRYWNLSSAVGGLAMAASLLLAFGLGLWMNASRLGDLLSPPNHDFVIDSGEDAEPGASPSAIGRRPSSGSPQNVRLVVGGSPGNEVQVPIVEGGNDSDWWRRPPAAMPDDVRRALERLGHQVRERRQLVPFDLEDGRRIMVPVDQVDVEPAEERLYQ